MGIIHKRKCPCKSWSIHKHFLILSFQKEKYITESLTQLQMFSHEHCDNRYIVKAFFHKLLPIYSSVISTPYMENF